MNQELLGMSSAQLRLIREMFGPHGDFKREWSRLTDAERQEIRDMARAQLELPSLGVLQLRVIMAWSGHTSFVKFSSEWVKLTEFERGEYARAAGVWC